MSDLIKLDKIAKRNGDIKCAVLSDNFISAQTGKNGFGQLTIAVDNKTISRIIQEKDILGVMYFVGKESWNKEGK